MSWKETNIQEEAKRAFAELFDRTIKDATDQVPTVEYNLPYPKKDFLKYAVAEKNVLLHGSSTRDIEILEPKQANDKAKVSGNKHAIYAVLDPILPIFYAIQDRQKLQGVIESGVEVNEDTGEEKYTFRIPKELLEIKPWTTGMIYIFDKSQFKPEQDDEGKPSGEWTSEKPVKPLAKLEVSPEDFPYLDAVEGK